MPEPKWYHNKVLVVLMLFLVLGPFGLPLLWKNPLFSKRWKWILTVLILVYTALVFKMFISAVTTSLRTLSDVGLGL